MPTRCGPGIPRGCTGHHREVRNILHDHRAQPDDGKRAHATTIADRSIGRHVGTLAEYSIPTHNGVRSDEGEITNRAIVRHVRAGPHDSMATNACARPHRGEWPNEAAVPYDRIVRNGAPRIDDRSPTPPRHAQRTYGADARRHFLDLMQRRDKANIVRKFAPVRERAEHRRAAYKFTPSDAVIQKSAKLNRLSAGGERMNRLRNKGTAARPAEYHNGPFGQGTSGRTIIERAFQDINERRTPSITSLCSCLPSERYSGRRTIRFATSSVTASDPAVRPNLRPAGALCRGT
ncbi:hypothetical protein BH10PSE9_BH10PSE9_04470 [soil metagenome]